MHSNASLTDKWRRWLQQIKEEMEQLFVSREVYIEVRNIIASNPSIRHNNRLYAWMSWNYVQSTLIAVRRLLAPRRDSASLIRLLADMEKHCALLTRDAHVRLYSEDQPWQAHGTFDGLAGEGAPSFPKQQLEADRHQLLALWKKLKPLANKRIAHLDEMAKLKPLPRYADMDAVIDMMEEQVRKYWLLLEAQDYSTLLPVPQYDWKDIFRLPWLPNPSQPHDLG